MFKVIVAVIVTAILAGGGLMINARWRVKKRNGLNLPKMVNRQFGKGNPAIAGFGVLIAPLLLAFGQYKIALIFLGISALLTVMVSLIIFFSKLPMKMAVIYILLGVGTITRFILNFSLIGIPIVRHVDMVAEFGMEKYMKIISQIAQDSNEYSNPNIKVYRRDIFGMREYLKVSKDGKQYYDPYDGAWHDTSDLSE